MNDATLMCFGESIGDLAHKLERLLKTQLAVTDRVTETLAPHVLHRDKRAPVDFVDVVNGSDVGMLHRRRGPRLLHKALPSRFVSSEIDGEELEGDFSLELGVLGEKDLSHPAFAEFF